MFDFVESEGLKVSRGLGNCCKFFVDVWIPGVVMMGKYLREMGSEELDFFRVALGPGSRGCRIFAGRGEGFSWFFPRFEWFLEGFLLGVAAFAAC